jgi:hypothetical protein
MIDRIIVNTVYLVPRQVNKFKKQHPNEEVLIADGTKARRVKSKEEAQYEIGWATARRSILILTTSGLYCGGWTIPLSNIQEATLLKISGGSLLKISTIDDLHYQFGLQRNPAWEKQKVLPLSVQDSALKFSKASLIFRLIVLAWLAYLISRQYSQDGLSISAILSLVLFVWISIPLLRFFRFPKAH